MKLGTENKTKVGFLVVLGLVAAYLVYTNVLSGPPSPAVSRPPVRDAGLEAPVPLPGGALQAPQSEQKAPPRPGLRNSAKEFRPALRSKKKEQQIDVRTVDPRLRLDLLAKVMAVPPAGGERDLFQIMKGPPVKETAAVKGPEPKVFPFTGPRQPPPPPAPRGPEPPPPPEPIPLKYYALVTERSDGKRTAYFVDNDNEILEGVEGATLKGRYRIVQIGPDKVLIEDTQQKRRQTVNLEPEISG